MSDLRLNRFEPVLTGYLGSCHNRQPVAVAVRRNLAEKLDRTGLPDTRSGEVHSVNVGFFVLSKQCGVKNIVNPPCSRQFQLVCDWSNDSCYLKRSFLPWADLVVVVCLQISHVQPYPISQLERSKCGSSPICHSISG